VGDTCRVSQPGFRHASTQPSRARRSRQVVRATKIHARRAYHPCAKDGRN